MTVQIRKKHVPVEEYFTRPEDEAFFQTFSFAPETPEEYLHRALKGLPVEIDSDEDTISFRVEDEENKKACMEALRAPVDEAEMLVDKELWPVPSYADMMFEV